MMRNKLRFGAILALLAAAVIGMSDSARAVLYLYEPFDYTAGDALGGIGASAGTPIGKSGTYDAGVGGGTYNWYARGTVSNYQSANDVQISSGTLSYAGLATSGGNSVSYGSADNSTGAYTTNLSRYADSIPLPVSVTSGSLYASFIVKINSRVYDGPGGTQTSWRHSIAGFVTDTSTSGNAGGALGSQSGTGVDTGGNFWMRRDPNDTTTNTTNFSPGKLSSDGIGQGAGAGGWQVSSPSTTTSNQFGQVQGQTSVTDSAGAPNPGPNLAPQTYFVVLKYAFDSVSGAPNAQVDSVSLWMNPGSGTLGVVNGETLASQAASGNVGSYYGATNAYGTATHDVSRVTGINSFALIGHRQNTGQTIAVDFDELRIGTTWQDVTPTATQPGDYNGDGKVNAADYVAWRQDPPAHGGTPDGYNTWRSNFGAGGGGAFLGAASGGVPEPCAALLAFAGAAATSLVRRRRYKAS